MPNHLNNSEMTRTIATLPNDRCASLKRLNQRPPWAPQRGELPRKRSSSGTGPSGAVTLLPGLAHRARELVLELAPRDLTKALVNMPVIGREDGIGYKLKVIGGGLVGRVCLWKKGREVDGGWEGF